MNKGQVRSDCHPNKGRLPSVLTIVAYYLPGYKSGGPVRTIANLVDHLGDEFDFRIVTADRDFLDRVPYAGVRVDAWNDLGKALVYYASPRARWTGALIRLLRETRYDVLYLNSFFDPVFTLVPLIARRLDLIPDKPVLIAPRGEFSPGALAVKGSKKRLYRYFMQSIGMYEGVIWQASNDQEAMDIRRVMRVPAERIAVAPNVPSIAPEEPPLLKHKREHGGALGIIFLSRITPKKNLTFALRVLQKVKVPVEFDIYGIIDDSRYWIQCQNIISQLPLNIVVKFHGSIEHKKVFSVLCQSDLFFLPTRGENYGHVIYEALASGTPALISDTTPWQDLGTEGVGWVCSLEEPDAFVEVIERMAGLVDEGRKNIRERAKRYGARVAHDEAVLKANRNLFLTVLTTGSQEDWMEQDTVRRLHGMGQRTVVDQPGGVSRKVPGKNNSPE